MFPHLTSFDFILLIIILLSIVFGAMRGFLKEIISIITWFTAFFIAILFTGHFVGYFDEFVRTDLLASIASFLSLFLGTLVVGAVINYFIVHLAHHAGLTLSDRVLGGGFGFVRGVMIAFLLVFLISNTAWANHSWFDRSALVYQLQGLSGWMQEQVIIVKKTTKRMM